MPYYDYKCKNEHTSEHLAKYDERKEPQVCKDCGEVAEFNQTFCTNFQYGEKYESFGADRHRWNLRENKRMKTRGKGYA